MSKIIKIYHRDDVKNVIIKEDRLLKTVLNNFFGNSGVLVYKKNGVEFILLTDNNYIYLDSDTDDYHFKKSKDKEVFLIIL